MGAEGIGDGKGTSSGTQKKVVLERREVVCHFEGRSDQGGKMVARDEGQGL